MSSSNNNSHINFDYMNIDLDLCDLIKSHNDQIYDDLKLCKSICKGNKCHLWDCPLAIKCKSCNARLDLNYIQPHFSLCELFPGLILCQESRRL
jgi:hypothetical protein